MSQIVIFEGIDGSGKDTQIAELKGRLKKAKKSCIVLHGLDRNNSIGKEITKLQQVTSKGMARTVSEHRMQHLLRSEQYRLLEEIKQAKDKGYEYIIINRSCFSTYAYSQANTHLAGKNRMFYVHNLMADFNLTDAWFVMLKYLVPNITIDVLFLDLPVTVALQRLKERNSKTETANETRSVLTKVKKQYNTLYSDIIDGTLFMEQYGETRAYHEDKLKAHKINANKNVSEIADNIYQLVTIG